MVASALPIFFARRLVHTPSGSKMCRDQRGAFQERPRHFKFALGFPMAGVAPEADQGLLGHVARIEPFLKYHSQMSA
jgi:hypothetical protein